MDFIQAEELLVKSGVGMECWDDLVIAAQMKRLKVPEIYSNDTDFDTIPGVKRIFK